MNRALKNPYIISLLEDRLVVRNNFFLTEENFIDNQMSVTDPNKTIYGAFTGGFKKSYEASKDFTPQEIQMYEKMKSSIDPAVEKAVQFSNGISSFLKKWNIPFPLVVAAVSAFFMGGLGAIPLAVLVYGAQRKAGDAAAWLVGLKHDDHHESFSFNDYYRRRMIEEGVYDTMTDLSGFAGRALGTAAGTVSKYGRAAVGAVSSFFQNAAKQAYGIVQGIMKNPKASAVHAMKLAIVVLIAVASGGVAATAYKMLTNPENWSGIASSVASMGLGTAEEVTKTLADTAHGHAMDAAHGAGHAMDAAHGAGHAMDAAHGAGHGIGHELSHFGKHAATDAAIHGAQRQIGKQGSKSLQALNIATGL